MIEPEYYISQLAAIFIGFESSLVRKAVAPSGIPFAHPKFLPTVAEANEWLVANRDWIVKIENYAKTGAYVSQRSYARPSKIGPNLFVPENTPWFEAVKEYAKAHPDDVRFDASHICCDGRAASGYWVYRYWWEENKNKKRAAP